MTQQLQSAHQLTAAYISGEHGPWLMTSWLSNRAPAHTALLIFPPFAEEMNCCRRLFALLARQLAEQGIDTYLPDFYGTGDSSGDFCAINLEIWHRDMLAWLPALSGYQQVYLLGCRFGAALLQAWWPAISTQINCSQVLLWQPQLHTDKFWLQLKRQQQLSQSSAVEPDADYMQAAGYRVPVTLQSQLGSMAGLWQLQVATLWLEATVSGVPGAAAVKACNDYTRLQGVTCTLPYWLSQEPTDCHELITASLQFLQRSPGLSGSSD